jgi:flavin-dependent dehydrogenase
MRYDVIVVGTRVAGAATAMLLARRGLRVLALDRARFPSDTLSTHQIQVPGVARLHRWGLLEPLLRAGTPPVRRIRLTVAGVEIAGTLPAHDGVDTLISPRRTTLDSLLIDAARAAGAEVRHGARVESLVWDGDRVVGVRTGTHEERARLVIGADGKHSTVAAAVRAGSYRSRPARTFAAYTYWDGAAVRDGHLHLRPGRAVAVFPTDDGLTMAFVGARRDEFEAARRDLRAHYLAGVDACGDLGARLRAGRQVERLRVTPDLPNTYRVGNGPGWALVGDAGLVMDPVSAHGITHAFGDAERLADAVVAGFACGDGAPLDTSIARAMRRRDAATRQVYRLTQRLARLENPNLLRRLAAAIADRPADVTALLGVFTGAVPAWRLMSPRTAARLCPLRTAGAR